MGCVFAANAPRGCRRRRGGRDNSANCISFCRGMEKGDEKRRGRPSRNISPQGAFLRPVQAGPAARFAGTGRIEYLSAVFDFADRSDGKWICDDTWVAGGQGKQIVRQGRPPYRICMRNGASAQQRSSKNVPGMAGAFVGYARSLFAPSVRAGFAKGNAWAAVAPACANRKRVAGTKGLQSYAAERRAGF